MGNWLVIGAGVAGSVVAARLAAAGASVCVIDEGTDTPTGDDLFDALAVADRVRSQPLVRRVSGGPLVPYTAGIGLGGGSAVNGLIVSRTGPFVHSHSLPVERQGGVGRSTADGRRVDVWSAYHAANSVPAETVVLSTAVDRLMIEAGRCVGVATSDGTEYRSANTVLCAGALGTPVMLMRSGVTVDGLGGGLQDHPSVMVIHRRPPSWPTSGPSIVGIERRGSLQVMRLRRLGPLDDGRAASVVMLMRPRSTGRVCVDHSGAAAIEFMLGTVDSDIDALAAGVTSVIADGIGGEIIEGPSSGDVASWVWRQVAESVPVVTHAASGCGMGTVVDRRGAIPGVSGLFCADASVFPAIPSVNPMLPTVQLAETLVDRWIADGLV